MVFNGKEVDPYAILKLKRGATKKEAKTAYRERAKEYHTDLHTDNIERYKTGMNLINEAYANVSKDIRERELEETKKRENLNDFTGLDLETMISVLRLQVNKYVERLEVAKMLCDLNGDLKFAQELSVIFETEIGVANRCLPLADSAYKENDEIGLKRAKSAFDKKREFFNSDFFEKLMNLFRQHLLFIYYSKEARYVVSNISSCQQNTNGVEWFVNNQDSVLTVVRGDQSIRMRLDKMLEEFALDEFVEVLNGEVTDANNEVVRKVNETLLASSASFRAFEDDEFYDAHRETIKKIFDDYHAKIDRRRNKIKYFKFALNIGEDVEKDLEGNIHNDERFNSLANALEARVFNSYLRGSQELKKELK